MAMCRAKRGKTAKAAYGAIFTSLPLDVQRWPCHAGSILRDPRGYAAAYTIEIQRRVMPASLTNWRLAPVVLALISVVAILHRH